MPQLRRSAPLGLAVIFTVSGIVHIVRPQVFDSIMPRPIPTRQRRPLIYLSGGAEIICAIGLIRRSWWAPGASTALLVAVFPANVQMALDAGSGRHPGAMDSRVLGWGRLPLEALMIWAARQARPPAQ